jgi:hypothetical protein
MVQGIGLAAGKQVEAVVEAHLLLEGVKEVVLRRAAVVRGGKRCGKTPAYRSRMTTLVMPRWISTARARAIRGEAPAAATKRRPFVSSTGI